MSELDAVLKELRALRAEFNPKVLLSLAETARRLGICRSTTLQTLIHSNQVKTVFVNGRRKVPATEVDRLAQEGFDVKAHRRGRRAAPVVRTPVGITDMDALKALCRR